MRMSSSFTLLLFLCSISQAQPWSTGSGTVYLYTSTDRVGFGSSSPATKFHIVGSGTGNTIARVRVESSDNQAGISFLSNGSGEVLIYSGNNADDLRFQTSSTERMVITSGGVVGIGTTNPQSSYKLSVVGKIRATDVKVETGWSDFVFDSAYQLMPLADVERFVQKNGHLPDVPSGETVHTEGIFVGEMQATIMRKIEELTLYVIDLEKRNQILEDRIRSLEDSAP